MNIKKLSACGMIVASLSMGTFGILGTSVPAFAAPSAGPYTIDPNGTYNLDITKYLGASTGGTNDGTQQSITGHDLLQGVPFDIYQVQGVDLTTNAGWATATALQSYTITQADITNGYVTVNGTQYALKKVSTVTTDATGQATYGTAGDAGLYLVNENLAGATVTDVTTGKSVATSSVTPSAPFLVTLPMTDPTNLNNWMSTVYVYPKNTTDAATKSVKDLGTAVSAAGTTDSSTVEYTINGSITPGLTGTQMGEYKIIDTLDPRLSSPTVKSVSVGGTTLTEGTDYTVSVSGQTVTVSMTASGLTALAAAEKADPSAQVTVVLDATATSVGTGATAGDIPNTASIIPNQGWADSHPGSNGVPTNTVDTKYGEVTITKTDATSGSTLAGAVFSLYQTTGTTMSPTASDCSSAVGGTPILTGITTAADGTVSVNGLQQSDFYNNVQQPATGGSYLVYCLVETTAPSGYNLQAQPIAFTINQDTAAGAVPVAVKDEKSNLGNSLPLTGGKGAASMGLGGLALLGGGAAVLVMRRRRHADDTADDIA